MAGLEDSADPRAWADLASLLEEGERVVLMFPQPPDLPDVVQPVQQRGIVQMLGPAEPPEPAAAPEGMATLGLDDAPYMVALAKLTEPGPMGLRTVTMGRWFGVRREGELIAMAGQRMHLTGLVEVSGVCTHPCARGLGLARSLILQVMHDIADRGERSFLHLKTENAAALGLYLPRWGSRLGRRSTWHSGTGRASVGHKMKSLEHLISIVRPPTKPNALSWNDWRWVALFGHFGTRLPEDYVQFNIVYGDGYFESISHPRTANISIYGHVESFGLAKMAPRRLTELRLAKERRPKSVPYPLYWEPNGLLPWGRTTNGVDLCWSVQGELVDNWGVVVLRQGTSKSECYDVSMTSSWPDFSVAASKAR